jgi:VCBS repeat-containing protein
VAGVLANDNDADGDPLTAVLAAGPSHGALALNANGSFTYTPNLGYVGADSFTYTANDGVRNSAPATGSLSVAAAAAAPGVKSVVINDGSAQRSMVRSVTVTFDSLVTLDAGAFTLVRTGGGRPTLTTRVSQANGQTSVVLTFSGTRTAYGSLGDGSWTLTVVAAKVHSAADPTLVMAANRVTQFHRLYGDSDGDRDVDATDKAAFSAALGKTDAASLATFDYNTDGLINGTDQSQFNKRYGKRI